MKFISTQGYKRNSPDVNRPLNVIPSGRITMQDVDFPVRGVDNLGNEMFMVPGGEYFFPGDYVVETPMMQRGGQTNNDREMVEGIADILTMVKDPVNRRQIAAEMVRDFKREGVKYDLQEFQKMAQVRMQGGGQLTMEDLRQRALAQSAPRIDNTRIVSQKRIVKQEAENPLDIFPFVKNVGIDTGIDQIPYASVMMGAKALNQGRPWTALSEFAKVPLGWIGDAGINALQENPTKYSINALEDSVIPFARLVKGANFGTGESIATQVGKQIMSSGEKPDSKWYARSFNLPGLYEAAKTYGVDNNTFTKFVEDNWENAGGDYKQILELAKTNLLKKQKGGRLTFQQYYTPAAESTGANYTPTMTVQAAEKLKAQRDAQELARRRQAIQASQAAASKPLRERLTPENLAQETGATGDKLRFFPNDPDSFIDDYLNPLKMVGDMASGLGRIPLNVKQGNYGAAALDVAIPVATGALAGLGAKSAGQFVNNLANPLAGVGNIASNAATKSTTLGQIKSGLQDLGYIYDQSLGYLFNNRANKKAIAEGNEWLKNWIQHPTTQAKIDNDFAGKINNSFVKNMYDVGYEQAKNFTPVSTELPLSVQLAKGFYPNKDNWGVSYLHHVDPMRRRMIEQGRMDAPIWHGSFISRTLDLPYKKRVGTTIHEGTHDWTSSFGLEASGQREFLERNINPEIHQDLGYWRLHGDDKTRTDLGKKRKYQAYLADPTEQHARIMELRKYLGHTPDFVSTPEYAQKVMDDLSAMRKNKRPIDSEGLFKVIDNDPQKLSNMFNRLWGVTPVAVAGAAAASEKKDGGQHGGLDRWFAEKWVDIKTGKECGRQEGEKRAGYPACRPSKRISEDTPKTASELSSSEKEKFKRSKTSSERISYQHKRKQDGGEWLDKYDEGGAIYTVKKGDTLSKIAAENKTTVNKIVQANNIKNPNIIGIDQKLVIPQGSSVNNAQTGSTQYVDWSEKKKNLDRLNNLPDEQLITGFYSDKPEQTYLVVDKKNAQMKVYKGDKVVKTYEVGVGANPGDAQTVTKIVNGKTDWSAGNKSTGAGAYTISNIDPASKAYYGLPSFNLKNDRGIEVATTIHGTPAGRRSRFDNNNVEDNRMSYGCINGKCFDLKDLQQHVDIETPVYVLPEDEGNRFQIVDGKPVLKVSAQNRAKYNSYVDATGKVQKGQGANQSVNTLSYSPIKAVFDENKFKEKVFSWNDLNDEKEYVQTTKPFYNALVKYKQSIMKNAKIPSDVYNELARMAFGIYGTESNFGDTHSAVGNFARASVKFIDPKNSSSPDYKSKATTYGANEDSRSVGLTQIRWNYLNKDEKQVLNSLGITSNMDFMDPEKAAIGTVALLGVRYNQQLTDDQKRDIWSHLPSKWNRRGNYSDRVKQNASYLNFKEATNKRQTGGQTNWLDNYTD